MLFSKVEGVLILVFHFITMCNFNKNWDVDMNQKAYRRGKKCLDRLFPVTWKNASNLTLKIYFFFRKKWHTTFLVTSEVGFNSDQFSYEFLKKILISVKKKLYNFEFCRKFQAPVIRAHECMLLLLLLFIKITLHNKEIPSWKYYERLK